MTDPRLTEVIADQIDQTASAELEDTREDYIEVDIGSSLAGRYRIDSKLGEGGMGVVYAGHDTQLDRPVALKLLKRNVSLDKKAVETLKGEAQVAMILTHPAIMRLINFEQHGGYAFLLMEYVKGEDLKNICARKTGGRLEPKTVAQIAYKVCSALDYAHRKNVVHRDIKPANIMISWNKEVKLMDFGIARVLLEESEEHPQIAGTVAYMAPEIFGGARPDSRADIYALGLTMYELMTGELPFKGATVQEIIKQHLNQQPEPPGIEDKALAAIVMTCLEKRPNARFQTALELKSALSKYLGLDEKDKISREKKIMERDKLRLDSQRRKMEKAMDKLKNERDALEQKLNREREVASSYQFAAYKKETKGEGIPLLLGLIAAASGFFGQWVATTLGEALLIDSLTLKSYETFTGALVGAVALAGPTAYRYGVSSAPVAALLGVIAGFSGYLAGFEAYEALTESDVWLPYAFVVYAALAVALSVGACACEARAKGGMTLVKLAPMVTIAALLSAVFPYIETAEFVFGMNEDDILYLYMPMLSGVVWLAVDMFGQRLD